MFNKRLWYINLCIKKYLGRECKDKNLIDEINRENFPFTIVPNGKGGFSLVLIDKNNEEIYFTLEEISSLIIRKMVDSIEAYLGKKVNSLVITVPSNFNDAQRDCMKQAANLAGIKVLSIINEPIASCFSLWIRSKWRKKNFSFWFRRENFNVTILKILKGEIKI